MLPSATILKNLNYEKYTFKVFILVFYVLGLPLNYFLTYYHDLKVKVNIKYIIYNLIFFKYILYKGTWITLFIITTIVLILYVNKVKNIELKENLIKIL